MLQTAVLVILLAILWIKSLRNFILFDQNFLCIRRHLEGPTTLLKGPNYQQGAKMYRNSSATFTFTL